MFAKRDGLFDTMAFGKHIIPKLVHASDIAITCAQVTFQKRAVNAGKCRVSIYRKICHSDFCK